MLLIRLTAQLWPTRQMGKQWGRSCSQERWLTAWSPLGWGYFLWGCEGAVMGVTSLGIRGVCPSPCGLCRGLCLGVGMRLDSAIGDESLRGVESGWLSRGRSSFQRLLATKLWPSPSTVQFLCLQDHLVQVCCCPLWRSVCSPCLPRQEVGWRAKLVLHGRGLAWAKWPACASWPSSTLLCQPGLDPVGWAKPARDSG